MTVGQLAAWRDNKRAGSTAVGWVVLTVASMAEYLESNSVVNLVDLRVEWRVGVMERR